MVAAAMKHIASNFAKLDKFEGVDFIRWQKKMHFLLSSISVVYVLTTPIPDDGDDAIMDQLRKRAKWDNDDYVCRCLILNGMSDYLFDIYQNVESSKKLWDSLEAKYMAEDASSKNFLVSNFTNYKMTDSRPVLEQYNELLGILGRFTQHKINIDESIKVSCIIDKLPPLWKDFKHTLKHLKEELTLVELGSHLRIEKSLRMQDSDKPKGNNVVGPSVVNMVEHNNSSLYNDNKGKCKHHDNIKADPNKKSKDDDVAWWVESGATVHAFMSTSKLNDLILWHARLSHVHFKRMEDMSKDGLIPAFNMDTEKLIYVDEALDKFKVFKTEVELQQGSQIKRFRTDMGGLSQGFWGEVMAVVRLLDPKLKTLGERGIECIFVGYTKNSKAFRFYVIEPNDSVSINSIIELRDVIFDENRFLLVPRPSLRILNETEEISGSVVPEEVTEEVVQQPELDLRKSKRNRTPKDFGPEIQLTYILKGK
ncbi:zinc finger, CCHC-type containing protein [Tanacetum coccineum]